MDKVHLTFELIGVLVTLCGVIAKFLPEGKAKDAFGHLGTLPIQAVKSALEKKDQ